MATTLFRIIKYGFQSFWRNGLLSAATVVVMVLALSVFEGLIIFRSITETAIAALEDKIDISVYFESNAQTDDILKVKKSLESIKEVKEVAYISREKALELFQERYGTEANIIQSLKELGDNPLLASLDIKAHDPNDYETIAGYLEGDTFKSLIKKVTFTESRLVIERLAKISDTVEKMGLALTIFLAFTAALVTFNTIRLAIYSNREEIGIMRLVGASNAFLNGPYIVQAVIFSVLATFLSILITAPLVSFSSPYIQSFIPEMDTYKYFYANLFSLFGYQFLFALALGVVSGTVAIRKYSKV